jgi:MFS transporter, DHA3 family, macrolide efflux protein
LSYTPPPNGFRTFTIVWLTQSLSVVGGAMMGFALNIYLVQGLYPAPEQKPELALALTALNLAFFIPVVFAAPLAGAFADRHDRKRTMILADVLNGLVCVVIIILMLEGVLQLWMLVLTGIVGALAGAFHYAAFDSSYAMLVPDRLLPRANGMMQTTWWSSGIVAPGLAAFVITLPALLSSDAAGTSLATVSNGVALCIAVNALTFAVSAAVLLAVRIPSPQRSDVGAGGKLEASIWSDIQEGMLYIWRRRPLLWLLGTFTLANFVGGTGSVITPLLVKFNLAADWTARGFSYEAALALVGTLGGIGGVTGGVLVSTWGGLKRRRIYGVLIPMLLTGVANIVFGSTPLLFVAAAAALTFSVMSTLLNAHSQTIWQTQTPRELQGRVFSVRRLIAQCTLPVGAISAGSLAGHFDPGHVLAALGLLLVLFCTAQLFNPYLLRVEDKEWLDQLAASSSEKR